jgi:hypothetical protein
MKLKTLLFAFAGLLIAGSLFAQPIVIDGGLTNAGLLEITINGDTNADGSRVDPNRIYELKAGEFYIQNTAINITNPGGTLTIRGQTGGKKPVWVKDEKDEVDVGSNQINSSLTMQNIHYQNMQMSDRAMPWSAFNLNADSAHLLVEDCMVEFVNGIIWNLNSVVTGAEIEIRNSYFRDFNLFTQWWASRVVQHKVPTDKLIFENNTVAGGGLTMLAQESLTEYAVINHNTFINNHKYPNLNQYWKECYFTNNLFVNANMVGEDMENVATGGQDPDALMHGITGVDTITGLRNVWIQGKFYVGGPGGDSTEMVDGLGLEDIIYYAADNVVTYSPTLDAYYNGTVDGIFEDAPTSYLEWGGVGAAPYKIVNVPGIWQNSRTEQLVADHANLVDENNHIYTIALDSLGLVTDPLPQAAADSFIQWNRNQWGVPDIATVGDPAKALYAFGDYDPTTIPGVEIEAAPAGEGGITKISDMIEDFSYSLTLTSKSDGLRIGALHWNDEAYDGAASIAAIKAAYEAVTDVEDVEVTSELQLRNYPNPFKSETTISFNLEKNSRVNLAVYDISGRKVEVLINENRLAGEHTVQFAPASMGNSIYFIKLTTEDATVTQRMMMLK